MKRLCSICLVLAISGCSVTNKIEPVIPVSEEPTAVETAVGVGVAAVLVSAAFLLISLAAVVNDAAD
ncbi:hypothetical protein [Yoonia sp. 2307UL14-13]|uniref:hypothetical protein n=1 Tax=Yoonia sp. 2307UL14-13 TaxID=3126506 RepID=UPI0030B0466B